jgi:hypothetical protein
LELAQAIRSKRVSSQDLIEAHLRRIEAVNPSINAVTVVLGEEALHGAKQADEAVARGGDRQSLMRAWGEFQQEHPLVIAPSPRTSHSVARWRRSGWRSRSARTGRFGSRRVIRPRGE